jgi:hypothetical protein
MRVVYANEAGRHNRFLREREELHTTPYVRDLYSMHFGKARSDPEGLQVLEKSMEVEESQSSTADKRAMVLSSPSRNHCFCAYSTDTWDCWTLLHCNST